MASIVVGNETGAPWLWQAAFDPVVCEELRSAAVCEAPAAARSRHSTTATLRLLRLVFQTQPRSFGCGHALQNSVPISIIHG